MKGYEPGMSFGEDVAARYDDVPRGDEAAAVRLNPIVCRYAWPSELDLMARVAGLRLIERWGGWLREPFTGASGLHVSVFGR